MIAFILSLPAAVLVAILIGAVVLAVILARFTTRPADNNGLILECDNPRNYRNLG